MHPRRKILTFGTAALLVAIFSATALAQVQINEIDYDQIGTDDNEWIELRNTTAAPLSLAGLELVHQNGNGCSEIWRLDLDPIVIPAAGYVIIGNAANAISSAPCFTTLVQFSGTANQVQNGPDDSVYIEDRHTGVIIDSVEYENPDPSICGISVPTNAADSNTVDGSIQRCGSFWFFLASSPCTANDCAVSNDESSWGKVKNHYHD